MKALISTTETGPLGLRVAQVVADNDIFPVAASLYWVSCGSEVVADTYWYVEQTNTFVTATQPAPDYAAQFSAAGQAYLDSVAQSWQYNDIATAATYYNSTVAKFQAESAALVAWRDQFWVAAETLMAEVLAGTTPMPADNAAFLALMPAAPARPVV